MIIKESQPQCAGEEVSECEVSYFGAIFKFLTETGVSTTGKTTNATGTDRTAHGRSAFQF